MVGYLSSFTNNNIGVHQSGPLLFLIFSIDLPTCFGNALINVYADATAIYVCGTDFRNIQKILQKEANTFVKSFHSKG